MNIKLISGIPVCFLGAVAALSLLSGCGERDSAGSHGHSHGKGDAHDHGAEATTPHGGTPVMIAAEKFHLELVPDPSAGKMQAYVLDGHLESYVQVQETNFLMEAKSDDTTRKLEFQRVPETQSGSIAAKSALFEAKAEWLNTVKAFEGSIPAITLNGSTFTNISFPFPKGTKHVH
jgi:hypothetical protein